MGAAFQDKHDHKSVLDLPRDPAAKKESGPTSSSTFMIVCGLMMRSLYALQHQHCTSMLNKSMSVCTRCWSRTLHAVARRPPSLHSQGSQQRQWLSRRGMASMSPEGQHKVLSLGTAFMVVLTIFKLLAADLEEADPVVYEILQRVRILYSTTACQHQVPDGSSLMRIM